MSLNEKALVTLQFTCADSICFAMECAGIPLVQDVTITNGKVDAISGAELCVSLLPGLGAEQRFSLPTVGAGQRASLPVVDLRLDPGWLRAVVEREPAQLVVQVRTHDSVLARVERKVEVLAFNEWPGLRAPTGLLASFATPNEPCLAPVIRAVGEQLQVATSEASILAYQAGSLGRARAEVGALYDCIRSSGVRYVGVPPSFEEVGQKIRLVETVLSEKLANCLDVTLLFSSVLEAMGFAPLVILLDTHSFCGVWLEDDRFPEGIVEDAARLRTLSQLGSLLLFDATAALSGRPFAEAQAVALKHLESEDRFTAALDVRALRRARYLPLPIRSDRRLDAAARFPTSDPSATSDGARLDTGTQTAAAAATRQETVVEVRFRKWKESLLDLTLRNRLLNFRPAGNSALRLDVPDAELFEDLLATDRSFQLLPRPAQSGLRSQELLSQRDVETAEVRKAFAEDLAKSVIYSAEPETELWERAIALDRTARRDLEEGGAATLFAAIGMLRWYESATNDDPRLAPLLLYPVKLEFERRTRRLRLRRQPDDPVPNQTLIEKMRMEFDVDLSGLAALEADESGVSVAALFRSARDAIQQMPRWEVIPQVHLGLFTFSKFLMWKDLHDNSERLLQSPVVRRIAENRPETSALASTHLDPSHLDADLSPADLPCVLDLDGTQLSAVAAALSGENFVLQGPPGTGKSQTITSLIGAALARGKSVLFVSEKMAALEVVHRRLRDVGLADFCLELHSHKTNKKDVVASFKAALDRPGTTQANGWDQGCNELASLRAELNGYVRALHAPTPLGMSYYQASARLHDLRYSPEIYLQIGSIAECTAAHFQSLGHAVARFAEVAARVVPVDEHPWRASGRTKLDAAEEQSLALLLNQAATALERVEETFVPLARRLGHVATGSWDEIDLIVRNAEALISGIRVLDREWHSGPVAQAALDAAVWPDLSAQAQAYASQRGAFEAQTQELQLRWQDAFFQLNLGELGATFERWSASLFSWFFLRAPKRKLLPAARGRALPSTVQIERDLKSAAELPQLRQGLLALEAVLSIALADVWPTVSTSPDTLLEALRRSERFRAASIALTRLPGFSELHLSEATTWGTVLAELEQYLAGLRAAQSDWRQLELGLRPQLEVAPTFWPALAAPGSRAHVLGWLKYWAGQTSRFRPWCHYVAAKTTLASQGLSGVVEAHRAGLAAERLSECFEASFLRRWRVAQLDAAPVLREFVGTSHHLRVERFASLDGQHQTVSRERVVELLERGLPRRDSALKGSELDVLLRECQRRARHQPVRKLLAAIPLLRAKLKPCLLMSPLSVAQYLPPEASFDLVVFDEASQIETHDAIGAIARGRQVVIVGDSKQLPPTRFFKRRSAEESPENENDVEDLDSILDEALAKGLPQLTLGWHYRSRHDSLIEFSNTQYYSEKLQIFPAARRYVEDLGVAWHPTPRGTYQPGDGPNGRTNPTEARAIVAHLVKSLQACEPGERTFGVVTFSLSQMKMIEDLLDKARAEHPTLEKHFEGPEKVFVKNLESVQGDERDEILFSICYGPDSPDSAGRTRPMRHQFGPLSLKGGERRLNVAITRARKQLRVFSSMTHNDIDLRKTASHGARDLRKFLEFASTRDVAQKRHDGRPGVFDSVVEREIHDELVRAGYVLHTKVGTGLYQLDLAIVHPKDARVYAMAVESDGPTYRDAVVARDRDRLRGAVLRDMLWRTHRVWSPDWLQDKDAEMRRLLEAVAAASVEPLREVQPHLEAQAASATAEWAEAEPPEEVARVSALPSPAGALSPARSYRGEVSYSSATLPRISAEPDDLYRPQSGPHVRRALEVLVETEAPIHCTLAFRRVIGCWGWSKLTRRAQDHLEEVVRTLSAEQRVHVTDEFLWRSREHAGNYQSFRRGGPEGKPRDLEHIPPEELASALAGVLSEALSAPEDELVRETARALGIERVGSRVGPAMQRGVELLLNRGFCTREAERLRWTQGIPVPPTTSEASSAHALTGPGPTPSPSSAAQTVQQLLAHPTLRARLQSSGVGETSLSAALTLLLNQCGRASTAEFAMGLSLPPFRVPGLVASLAQVLNVDSYPILRLTSQGGAVELDRDVLRQAFALDAGPRAGS